VFCLRITAIIRRYIPDLLAVLVRQPWELFRLLFGYLRAALDQAHKPLIPRSRQKSALREPVNQDDFAVGNWPFRLPHCVPLAP
jgi:hypothetical protein